MKPIWRFKGGVKLPGFKGLSNQTPITPLPVPDRLVIPIQQHIGEAAKPIVEIGDHIYKGQLIAQSSSFVSAPVHASSSGKVTDIGHYNIPHPSGIQQECIVIDTDGLDQWDPSIAEFDHCNDLSSEQLRKMIKNAGIVGLGGAVFPSAAKLKPTRPIDTLIINGVECEPYITCDDALMRMYAVEVVKGIGLLRKILDPVECVIAIEDNKPEAIYAIQQAIDILGTEGNGFVNLLSVAEVPTVFPAGGEKQLIKVITGKEVPQHSLPYEVGVVCLNVGTTVAIYNAIAKGQPLVSRIVTVTGDTVRQPANYEVAIGTPVADLLAAAGGTTVTDYQLIMGGPMMGQVLPGDNVPVIKASNCILVQENAQRQASRAMPCIRCGACATACPMQLLPQQLYWHARGKNVEKLNHYHLFDCIECGCCAVVCPSKIPLVQYFRFAKADTIEQEEKARFADQSRLRMQARESRLEKIKREQEERKAKRKAERQRKKQQAGNDNRQTDKPKASVG